jgi:hypothetical protein
MEESEEHGSWNEVIVLLKGAAIHLYNKCEFYYNWGLALIRIDFLLL